MFSPFIFIMNLVAFTLVNISAVKIRDMDASRNGKAISSVGIPFKFTRVNNFDCFPALYHERKIVVVGDYGVVGYQNVRKDYGLGYIIANDCEFKIKSDNFLAVRRYAYGLSCNANINDFGLPARDYAYVEYACSLPNARYVRGYFSVVFQEKTSVNHYKAFLHYRDTSFDSVNINIKRSKVWLKFALRSHCRDSKCVFSGLSSALSFVNGHTQENETQESSYIPKEGYIRHTPLRTEVVALNLIVYFGLIFLGLAGFIFGVYCRVKLNIVEGSYLGSFCAFFIIMWIAFYVPY